MPLAVVIPVLDESAQIDRCLEAVLAHQDIDEIIVVDGGSRDDTVRRARRYPVRVISAPKGRASQMNCGAAATGADAIVFLHADARLPHDAVPRIRAALSNRGVVGGAFHIRTVPDRPGTRLWRPVLRLADLRARYTGLPYGDQAIFARASVFRALGGFPPWPILEDLELSRRLRDRGRLVVIDRPVRVSGRRFMARPIRGAVLVNAIPYLHRAGVPLERLASWYEDVR